MDITIAQIIKDWIKDNKLESHFRVSTWKEVSAIYCSCDNSYFPIIFFNDDRATDFDTFSTNTHDPHFFDKLRKMMVINHNDMVSHCIS